MKQLLLGSLLLLCSAPLWAGIEVHRFESPAQEADYLALVAELRCLVCQNQNLADSNAELAQDLREEVYKMIKSGASRQEVISFMVERYGDFVLYRPPVQANTAALWIGPFVILAVGIGLALVFIRRNRLASGDETGEAATSRGEDA